MTVNARNLSPHGSIRFGHEQFELFVHEATGVAVVRTLDGKMVSCHPFVHQSKCDLDQLRKSGKWDKTDITVRIAGFVYNLSKVHTKTSAEKAAKLNCRCGVCRAVFAALDRVNDAVEQGA